MSHEIKVYLLPDGRSAIITSPTLDAGGEIAEGEDVEYMFDAGGARTAIGTFEERYDYAQKIGKALGFPVVLFDITSGVTDDSFAGPESV